MKSSASSYNQQFIAGDVSWDYCIISSFSGGGVDPTKSIEVLGMISEVNIFEDIFSHSVHGYILMVDTHNIINQFPFVGMETFYMGIKTPGFNNRIDKAFRIYKVSDHVVSGNKQVYKLHFMSIDAWADIRFNTGSKLDGTPGTLIKQLLEKLHAWDNFYSSVKIDPPDLTDVDTNQTKSVRLVPPNWSAFECVKWLEKYALNSDEIADYLFFETNKRYRFKSLTDLFKQDISDLFIIDHSTPGGDAKHQMIKIHEFRHLEASDNLTRFLNRAYGHTLYDINLYNKKITKSKWVWSDIHNYNKNSTGEGMTPLIPSSQEVIIDPEHNLATSYSTSMMCFDNSNEFDEKANLTRLPALNFLQLDKADFDIWGRSWLEVGDLVGIITGTNVQNQREQFDSKSTSTWLITAIHHRLAPSQHKMTLQVIRNSTLESKF